MTVQTSRLRQQLNGALHDAAPTDADRLCWLEAEAGRLRLVFHAARRDYLAATKLPLDAVNERHAGWVAMNAAALDYALAADFAAIARSLGDRP